MDTVRICRYDRGWPHEFSELAFGVRPILGGVGRRIDHIGSTSVPGLDAKDVIDIQVSVANPTDLGGAAQALAEAGWVLLPDILGDHPVPGLSTKRADWEKRILREPTGTRRVNLHVRIEGRPNQRYPLLFRDYLRAHPSSAESYARLKRDLASLLPEDPGRYADVKDAGCDLIYYAAEQWADATGWAAAAE